MKLMLNIKKIGHQFATFLTLLILAWSISACWQAYATSKQFSWPWLLVSLLVISLAYFAIDRLSKVLMSRFLGWFLLVLFLLTIPKLILLFALPMVPVSDMWTYRLLAELHAAGFSWQTLLERGLMDLNLLYSHVLHIGSAFSVIYWLLDSSIVSIQLTNILLTFLDAVIIYFIVKSWGGKRAGIIAALLFYLIPSYYVYSILLGAEPLWLTFTLLALYFFNALFLPRYRHSQIQFWLTLLIMIVCLIVGNLFRPMNLIFAIAFFIYSIFAFGKEVKAQDYTSQRHLLAGALILGSLLLFSSFSTKLDRLWYQIPVANSDVAIAYTIATGQNKEYNGMYSTTIIDHLEKINHDKKLSQFDKQEKTKDYLTDFAAKEINERTDEGKWWPFLNQKIQTLHTSTAWVSLIYLNLDLYHSDHAFDQNQSAKIYATLIAATELVLLVISFLGLLRRLVARKQANISYRNDNGLFYMEMIFVGISLFYLLVEVQARYQLPLYLPLVIFVALGFYADGKDCHLEPTDYANN